MCDTKEELTLIIIDNLIEQTSNNGKKISIQDIYDLKNIFFYFDINYVRQPDINESKLLFVTQCLTYLIRERETIKKYNYLAEVMVLKRYLPSIVDINKIDGELYRYFTEIYN